jgi:hypothetical protein
LQLLSLFWGPIPWMIESPPVSRNGCSQGGRRHRAAHAGAESSDWPRCSG